MTWTPLNCITVCLFLFAFGEFLSKKTKGAISSLLFACILFIAGFWSGLLPKDVTATSGLTQLMSNFGLALMITNIGTLIDLEDLVREWKTVVIALCSIVAIALVSFTVGSWLFGREAALVAAPPIAGSTVAGIVVTTAAEAANRPDLAALVVLVIAVQKFFGIPISTFCIRKELKNKRGTGYFKQDLAAESTLRLPSMRLFPETPKYLRTNTVYICKVALVACLADFVGKLTLIPGSEPANYILHPNVAYLLFGMIFARIGFLEKDIFAKANSSGIITFGLMLMLPGSLAKLTPSGLASMAFPLFGMLALCSVAIILICGLVGKLLGYSPLASIAIGFACMLAYPATQIITTECVDCFEWEADVEKQRAMDYMLPKMILAGFVTVTIASVAFASILSPIIFK